MIKIIAITLIILCMGPDYASSGQIGTIAPAFCLLDLNGQIITPAQFEGKVVFLDFWAIWCRSCREEFPDDANQGRTVKTLLVADHDNGTLIETENAVWVMGGKKTGVMTQLPKWAFQTKAAAEVLIKTKGGKIVSLEEALAAAFGELIQAPQ